MVMTTGPLPDFCWWLSTNAVPNNRLVQLQLQQARRGELEALRRMRKRHQRLLMTCRQRSAVRPPGFVTAEPESLGIKRVLQSIGLSLRDQGQWDGGVVRGRR